MHLIVSDSDVCSAAHTFTSGNPDRPETVQGLFDSSLVMSGSSYEYTPKKEELIEYFCMVHPWITGTIIVGAGDDNTDNDPVPLTPKDNPLEIENQQLKDQIVDLKLENRQLKN